MINFATLIDGVLREETIIPDGARNDVAKKCERAIQLALINQIAHDMKGKLVLAVDGDMEYLIRTSVYATDDEEQLYTADANASVDSDYDPFLEGDEPSEPSTDQSDSD